MNAKDQLETIKKYGMETVQKLEEGSKKSKVCTYMTIICDIAANQDKETLRVNIKSGLEQLFNIKSQAELDEKPILKQFLTPLLVCLKSYLKSDKNIDEIEPFDSKQFKYFGDIKELDKLFFSKQSK